MTIRNNYDLIQSQIHRIRIGLFSFLPEKQLTNRSNKAKPGSIQLTPAVLQISMLQFILKYLPGKEAVLYMLIISSTGCYRVYADT